MYSSRHCMSNRALLTGRSSSEIDMQAYNVIPPNSPVASSKRFFVKRSSIAASSFSTSSAAYSGSSPGGYESPITSCMETLLERVIRCLTCHSPRQCQVSLRDTRLSHILRSRRSSFIAGALIPRPVRKCGLSRFWRLYPLHRLPG